MAASKTAAYVALYRALETTETRRAPLFSDPFAKRFLPHELRWAERAARLRPLRRALERYADHRAPGARSSAIGRTRFIDDLVRHRVASGTEQLVILGAGFDTRAHRMPELDETHVFEVDRIETQRVKRARMDDAFDPRRARVTYVPVDFQRDDLGERLRASGWRPDSPTLFIWEGVTNYLSERAVAEVLTFIGSAAPTSAVVFTYIHRGVLDGSARFVGSEKLVANVQRLGEPWTFGLVPDELAAFVAPFGLTVEENLGADEYRRRYLTKSDRGLEGYAFYRIAVCGVAGTARGSGAEPAAA